ncbi:MAG TPA: hypothetical protein VNU01_04575, partial [Egibacteraceae bacterium]|nr:hypothetical protein [Egibacteraceae bacterium]
MALLLGALLLAAAPAQAQTRTYAATATGTSAQVLVGGQQLQLGHTSVAIRSDAAQEVPNCPADQVACAHAATVVGVNDALASAPKGPGEAVGEPNGALPEDTAPLAIAHLGRAVAKAATGGASGETDLLHLELTATQTIAENAAPVVDGLKQVSEQLFGPLAEGDPSGELGQRLKQSFDSLVENIDENPLVEIDLLPSLSTVTDNGTLTTAEAIAKGAQIVISPTAASDVVAPEGLIIVEIGSSRAYADSAGKTEGNAAAVLLKIFNPVTGAYDEHGVPAGEYTCAGEGTPLYTCVGLGTTKAEAGAFQAGGVSVNALDGNLKIEVGAAQAGASASVAPAAGPPAPAPLPTTGGGLAHRGST